jgi:hypothetical protein
LVSALDRGPGVPPFEPGWGRQSRKPARVTSSLLDNVEQRSALYRVISNALRRRLVCRERIFIEHFSNGKVRREVASNLLTSLPFCREMGEILLFRSARPIRVEQEGVHRQGSFLFKLLFRWYAKIANKTYTWHGEQLV